MKFTTKRRFLWAALIGFFFWLLGSYLYHFQLYSDIEQGGITDFENTFQDNSHMRSPSFDLVQCILLVQLPPP